MRRGYRPEGEIKSDISLLTLFRRSNVFYLPRIPGDDPNVLYNLVSIDSTAQCENADLAHAERRASMTLLGWRVFGALLRSMNVREAKEEAAIRMLPEP